jgi:hypothetical protein
LLYALHGRPVFFRVDYNHTNIVVALHQKGVLLNNSNPARSQNWKRLVLNYLSKLKNTT